MKQTNFTLLFFAVITLMACNKDKYDVTITQYDDEQIKNYISANGITGMTRDGSGMYYKIINSGSGKAIEYSDNISIVFTARTVDGRFVSEDTVINHYQGYAGHISSTGYPLGFGVKGLQQAVHDILKYRGASMRILIPSNLAYGVGGAGAGSSEVSTRIGGNQCLDVYVHLISDQEKYDQSVIKNFIASNNLGSSVLEDPTDHYWYNIRTPGTGTVPINENSTITATYTVRLLNGTVVNEYNLVGGALLEIPNQIKGLQAGLKKYATAGALITFVFPSSLAYGTTSATGIPANSVIRYEIQVIATAP